MRTLREICEKPPIDFDMWGEEVIIDYDAKKSLA